MSTPAFPAEPIAHDSGPRRHSLFVRPDSALALLTDEGQEEDDDGNDEQLQSIDRISDILSNLIREANEAVHGIEKEKAYFCKTKQTLAPSQKPLSSHLSAHATTSSSTAKHNVAQYSRLPRPISNTNSNSCRAEDPFLSVDRPRPRSPFNHRYRVSSARPLSCPMLVLPRKSRTSNSHRRKQSLIREPLLESFKRLDSSMALVDSLSRDLATNETSLSASIPDDSPSLPISSPSSSFSSCAPQHLAYLFLVPLLHIPHALISAVFDSLSRATPGGPILSGLIAWTCVFALGNLMVDQTNAELISREGGCGDDSRLCLPGAYSAGRNPEPQSPVVMPEDSTSERLPRHVTRKRRSARRSTLFRRRQCHRCPDPSTRSTVVPSVFFATDGKKDGQRKRRHSF